MVNRVTRKRVVSDLNLAVKEYPPHLNCTGVCVVRAWPAAQNDEVIIVFMLIKNKKSPI